MDREKDRSDRELDVFRFGDNIDFKSMKDSLRVEEFINYFDYQYEDPKRKDMFGVTLEVGNCPWNNEAELLRIGVKAKELDTADTRSNIVLLVDTSGSMFYGNKLPLAIKAIKTLVKNFDENDVISCVTYAGSDDVLFEGYHGSDYDKICNYLDQLEAYGSTNGASGIQTAYRIAEDHYIKGGNNRVILMTDGDFNVGVSSESGLIDLIRSYAETNIFFSACGFGTDTYSDTRMEAMADNGNGNYDYIDCGKEAERFFTEQFESTIFTVAKDVKFQLDFNPNKVAAYRQVGYVNRKLEAEDFDNDAVDGGEVGSGQAVTILYEIIPVGSPASEKYIASGSKYTEVVATGKDNVYGTVKIRYKNPEDQESVLEEYEITDAVKTEEMSDDMKWTSFVSDAIMSLRNADYDRVDQITKEILSEKSVAEDDRKLEFAFLLSNCKILYENQ